MNNRELQGKVSSAMYTLIRDKGVASPVEVLMSIGVLTKENYENWRFGRSVPYLERVCQINLNKLSIVNKEICAYAKKHNLKPSWCAYNKWGKGKSTRLRFSKNGDEQIERAYATHYISQTMVDEAKERRDFNKRKNELASTIAPCGLVCGLCSEVSHCKGCRAADGCERAGTCYQRKCCTEKNIKGCWKCPDFPCGEDMFSNEHDVRLRAFVRCAKEDGVKSLAAYLLRNQENGIVYHRNLQSHKGNYDGLGSEDAVLELLRKGRASDT